MDEERDIRQSGPADEEMMPNEAISGESAPEQEVQIDPHRLKMLMERMRGEQNLILGIIGGTVGAAIGAALWTTITVFTGYQVGYMALGVGFLAGLGVRLLGKGIDKSFKVTGSLLSLAGCLVGNLAVLIVMISRETSMTVSELIARLTPDIIVKLSIANFHPVDLIFYGLALSVGYRTAVRKIPQEELEKLMKV